MIEVVTGASTSPGSIAGAAAESLVVRVAPFSSSEAPAGAAAEIRVAIADPELAARLTDAVTRAVRDAAAIGEPGPVAVVRLRSRKRLARQAGRLGGAIAVVAVTARNARHLMALVDGIRAAGASGVQLVWDGADPPRDAVEHHVFAVLERARATPAGPPVVLAAMDAPVAALRFLVAWRDRARQPAEPGAVPDPTARNEPR